MLIVILRFSLYCDIMFFMSVTPELLESPIPATRAESAALLVEVVNVALYGGEDPWNSDFLEKDGVRFKSIDKGHIAVASPKSGGPNIQCKYDPSARRELLRGSDEKVHIASLAIGEKTYDVFASTTENHTNEDGEEDVLAEMFTLLEYNEGMEEIEIARQLDFDALAEDVTIEVFEDLPQHGALMRNLGQLGMRFAELVDDESSPSQIAQSEGLIAQAGSSDASLAMELSLSATTIDSATAQALTAALREDYEPIARW